MSKAVGLAVGLADICVSVDLYLCPKPLAQPLAQQVAQPVAEPRKHKQDVPGIELKPVSSHLRPVFAHPHGHNGFC